LTFGYLIGFGNEPQGQEKKEAEYEIKPDR